MGSTLLSNGPLTIERRNRMDVQEILTYVIGSLLLLVPVTSDPKPPLQEVVVEAEKRVILNERDVACLSKNIYFEARGEGTEGQVAVAHVTLNRVEHKKFPNTVCEVVHQAKVWDGHPVRYKCQFSWYCDGKSDRIDDWRSYHAITEVARMALLGDIEDNTNGSTFYHANYVKPDWSNHMAIAVIHDKHIFYRMR